MQLINIRALRHATRWYVLIVAMVLVLTVAGWFRCALTSASRQRQLRMDLADLSNGNGFAIYRAAVVRSDSPNQPCVVPRDPRPWAVPYFLVQWLGEDFFSHGIYAVRMGGPRRLYNGERIDDVLSRVRPFLEALSDTEVIDLSDTDLTDEGLMQLEGMKNLRFVMAKNTKVSKNGGESLTKRSPRVQVYLDRRYE